MDKPCRVCGTIFTQGKTKRLLCKPSRNEWQRANRPSRSVVPGAVKRQHASPTKYPTGEDQLSARREWRRLYQRKYRQTKSIKERESVYSRVHEAIKAGRIVRQPCEVCRTAPAEAHHDDYSKPLDVRWLCRAHHAQHHAERRAQF